MWSSTASYAAHQRARFMQPDPARWMRPDAERWIRPDAARFLKPGARPQDVFPALDRKYNPNQPRVPKGNPDGGQWTLGAEGAWRLPAGAPGRNDPRVLSDADPETVKPGQQYAQVRGRRGGGTVLINGQEVELSPAQGARLAAVRVRAEAALARVRDVDPSWKAPQSAYATPEGLIRAYEADTLAAEGRILELMKKGALPGLYAGESIPARGPGRHFNSSERREINRIGYETGCHTCGERAPRTISGNFCMDHQRPNALNSDGRAQRLYPHCLLCSSRQGPFVRDLKGPK